MKKPARQAQFSTLGDPRSVRLLLSIVTGNRVRFAGLCVTLPDDGVPERPAVSVMEAAGDALSMERTPAAIRALWDEGIIGPAIPPGRRHRQDS